MTDREAMQMALNALENVNCDSIHEQSCSVCNATEALRTALARPKKKWKGLTNAELEHFEDTIQEGNFEHPAEIVYSIASILREKNT